MILKEERNGQQWLFIATRHTVSEFCGLACKYHAFDLREAAKQMIDSLCFVSGSSWVEKPGSTKMLCDGGQETWPLCLSFPRCKIRTVTAWLLHLLTTLIQLVLRKCPYLQECYLRASFMSHRSPCTLFWACAISAALSLADHSSFLEISFLGFRDAPPSWFCSQLPRSFRILCWICLSPFLVLKLCSLESFVLCPIPHLNLLLKLTRWWLHRVIFNSLSLPCFVCFTCLYLFV